MQNLFQPINSSSQVSKLDPRTKLGISISLFTLFLFEASVNHLLILLCFVFSLSILTQGFKSTIMLLWYLKWYLLVFLLLFQFYSNDYTILLKTLIKLIGFIFAFTILSKTTNPDEFVDALIKLGIPPNLSWNIGVALRQAIFLFDEISHILLIQRQRLNYSGNNIYLKFKYRIYEIYILLLSLISRSIIVSSEFTDALHARGYQHPNKQIITFTSSFTILDLVFTIIYIVSPILIIAIA